MNLKQRYCLELPTSISFVSSFDQSLVVKLSTFWEFLCYLHAAGNIDIRMHYVFATKVYF